MPTTTTTTTTTSRSSNNNHHHHHHQRQASAGAGAQLVVAAVLVLNLRIVVDVSGAWYLPPVTRRNTFTLLYVRFSQDDPCAIQHYQAWRTRYGFAHDEQIDEDGNAF